VRNARQVLGQLTGSVVQSLDGNSREPVSDTVSVEFEGFACDVRSGAWPALESRTVS
jgi:hypothetical protein